MRRHPLALLATGAALLSGAFAQSNDAPRNNGGEVVFTYSDPSVGAPPGSPPDLQGDLFWTVHPGFDQLAYAHPDGTARMEVAGYYESLFDTDWTTSPWFYPRMHGPALRGASGALEPAFFQLGLTSEVTVEIGPSGFGNPCTISPSLCTPCATSGQGWIVDIQFSPPSLPGPIVSALGASASDLATSWFVPGGMPATGGPCGVGDYALQDVHSTDETAADPTGQGLSPWGGFQLAGGGPVPEAISSAVEGNVTWREPILNPRADSGLALGLEEGPNGGGALNGFLLGVSGGGARLAVELRDELGFGAPPGAPDGGGSGNLAFAGASFTPLPVPGVAVLGAQVLVLPDHLFSGTVQVWQGSVVPVTFVFTPEGAFRSTALAVPPALAGASLYLQGLTLDLATLGAHTTNRVRVRLF
jgi:hypothetical protein